MVILARLGIAAVFAFYARTSLYRFSLFQSQLLSQPLRPAWMFSSISRLPLSSIHNKLIPLSCAVMSTSSSACSASRVIDSDKLLYSIPASFRGGFSGDEQIDADVVYQVGGFFLLKLFLFEIQNIVTSMIEWKE